MIDGGGSGESRLTGEKRIKRVHNQMQRAHPDSSKPAVKHIFR